MTVKYKVFIYGTLRRGQPLHDQMSGVYHCDTFTSADFTMLDLGAYPAVIPRGKTKIWGEVWEVTPSTLDDLDVIEGVPDLYVRSRCVTINGHECFIYLLSPTTAKETTHYKEVKSGDWVTYRSHLKAMRKYGD